MPSVDAATRFGSNARLRHGTEYSVQPHAIVELKFGVRGAMANVNPSEDELVGSGISSLSAQCSGLSGVVVSRSRHAWVSEWGFMGGVCAVGVY